MAHNAFDTAQEVLAEGFTGQAAVEEWMLRLTALGERFCPIAYEQLLVTGVESTPEEQAAQSASAGAQLVGVEGFVGEFVYPDVPGEPYV